jgi:hypothetical protein
VHLRRNPYPGGKSFERYRISSPERDATLEVVSNTAARLQKASALISKPTVRKDIQKRYLEYYARRISSDL